MKKKPKYNREIIEPKVNLCLKIYKTETSLGL